MQRGQGRGATVKAVGALFYLAAFAWSLSAVITLLIAARIMSEPASDGPVRPPYPSSLWLGWAVLYVAIAGVHFVLGHSLRALRKSGRYIAIFASLVLWVLPLLLGPVFGGIALYFVPLSMALCAVVLGILVSAKTAAVFSRQ